MKTYQFYLIRHGSTEANERGRIIGSTDQPLTDRGREKLREISGYLAPYPVEAVFTSPLVRASETARILYPGSRPIVLSDLREYHFGIHENGDFHALCFAEGRSPEKFLEECRTAEGAEDLQQFCDRVFGVFAKIVDGCMRSGVRSAAVITHGTVIMTLMSAFAYPKRERMIDWLCGNGTGYLLKTDPAMWMRDRIVEAVAVTPSPRPDEPADSGNED